MLNLTPFFIIFFLLISPLKAEILNFCSFPDEFVDLSRRISNDGLIYVVLNDGEPAVEASFQTKLPPHLVLDLYQSYLSSKGIKDKIGKFSETAWRWSGEINEEEKTVLISYLPREGKTTIKLISCRKEPGFAKHYPSLIKVYPELYLKGAKITLSREVFQGNHFSGLFLYSVSVSPETALKNMESRLLRTGWKGRAKGSPDLCMLFKDNFSATIVATREKGETSLLITIAHLGRPTKQ